MTKLYLVLVSFMSTAADRVRSNDEGATAVDYGNGRLYVTGRSTSRLHIVGPASRRSSGSGGLGGGPE